MRKFCGLALAAGSILATVPAASAQAAPYLPKWQARWEASKEVQHVIWSWDTNDTVDYWIEDARDCTRRRRNVVLCEATINSESVYWGTSQCDYTVRVKKLRGGFVQATFPSDADSCA